jgi:2-phosphosulfolactate phosphatase
MQDSGINLLSLLEGAHAAKGTVVVIDVYRAFTTAAIAFQQGAAKIAVNFR